MQRTKNHQIIFVEIMVNCISQYRKCLEIRLEFYIPSNIITLRKMHQQVTSSNTHAQEEQDSEATVGTGLPKLARRRYFVLIYSFNKK